MSYLEELLDFVEKEGGNIETTRKSVIDSAAALHVSVEGIAGAILMCMRGDTSVNTVKLRKEGKSE